MENNAELIAQCEAKAKQWLSPSFDEKTRQEVQDLLDNPDKTNLIEAFYRNLEFGTGGLHVHHRRLPCLRLLQRRGGMDT